MRSRNIQGQQDILPRKSKLARQATVENKMPVLEQGSKMRVQSAIRSPRTADASRSRRRGLGSPSTKETVGQRNFFEDIQHWAASSARGSGQNSDFYQSLDLKVEPMLACAGPMFTGYEPDMNGPMTPAYPDFLYSPESPIFSNGDAFGQISSGAKVSHAFARSEAPLMEFTTSAGGITSNSKEFHGSDASLNGSALSPHFWLDTPSEDGIPTCLDMSGVTYGPWSPSIASADMSLSSGCPSGSLMPSNYLGSPVGLSGADDLASVPSNDEFLQFTLGQDASRKGSYDGIDVARSVSSRKFFISLRQSRSMSSQENTFQPNHPLQLGYHEVAYTLPQGGVRAKAFYSNRLGSDGENIKARQHELYNVGPGPDGLYHCPFVGEGECRRKPDKLKCNYDKHMDSHLKPYRCQDPACADVPFSSTACLLRHEREAHGLHGHGERPYSCYFEGCERATPGYGFPRRWNLQDHMRRVHNYVLPDADSAGGADTGTVRKKRASQASGSSRRASKQVSGRSRA